MNNQGTYFAKIKDSGSGFWKDDRAKPYIWVRIATVHLWAVGTDGKPAWVPYPDDGLDKDVNIFLSHAARHAHGFRKLAALGFTGDFKAPKFSGKSMTEGIIVTCEHVPGGKGKMYEQWNLPDAPKEQLPDSVDVELKKDWGEYISPTPKVPDAVPPTSVFDPNVDDGIPY